MVRDVHRINRMTTFLLIRHGMTDAVGNYLAGWAAGVHLNERGREQVDQVGRNLASLRLDAVYSSPLERARETAEAIAIHHGCVVQLRARLGEVRFGDWTGRSIAELEAGDAGWRAWNSYRGTSRTPNGESYLELQDRVVSTLMAIAHDHPNGLIVVVSHADALRAALIQFLGMPGDFCLRLDVRPASVSVLQITEGEPRVAAVNIPVDGISGLLEPAW
jgi:broad specificity phosphatase PhoE